MKKKIFLLTVLTAVFALLLCFGAGAYDYHSGELLVNNTDILEAENNTVKCGDGTAVYDEDSQTLTLTNATITVPDNSNVSSYCQSGIGVGNDLERGLNIVLVGENKIITNNSLSNGIYVAGDNNSLTISGEGSLSITCNNGKCGIYSASNGGDIIIDGVKLDIHSEGNNGNGIYSLNGAVQVLNGANVTCSTGSTSIRGNSVSIKNSRVTADSTGISNSKSIYSSNDIDITGSTVNCSSSGEAIQSAYGNIAISGSSVKAVSTASSALKTEYAERADFVPTSISITDGSTVTLNSCGIFPCAETCNLRVDGSTLTVNSNTDACAILAWYEIKFNHSTVEAYTDSGTDYSWVPIYCENGPISITNCDVLSESNGYYAIYSWKDAVRISDSIVTACSNSTDYGAINAGDWVYIDGSWLVTDNGLQNGGTLSNSVLFEDGTGQAYGDAELPGDVTLPEGHVLVLREDENLIIPKRVTLTNYGTIQVMGGSFVNNGTYVDYGKTVDENGDIVNIIEGSGDFPNNWFVTVSYGNGAADTVYRIVKGEDFILPDAPSKPGYIFLGWRCGQDTFGAGDMVDIISNAAFQAVWANMPDISPSEPDEPVEPVEFPFTDVSEADWYYDAVYYVWANGVMEGVEADEFAPNSPLTRAMVWAMLARLDGVEVSGDGWVAAAQEWAVESGVSDGTDPTGYITREQLVTMLWRCKGSPAVEFELTAPDAGEISDWALEAMRWAAATGLIEGDEFGNLTPTATSTRAQAATFMLRFGK